MCSGTGLGARRGAAASEKAHVLGRVRVGGWVEGPGESVFQGRAQPGLLNDFRGGAVSETPVCMKLGLDFAGGT